MVEVETGKSSFTDNIKKNQALGTPIIITAFTNKKLLADAEQSFTPQSNVRLTTVRDALALTSQSLEK